MGVELEIIDREARAVVPAEDLDARARLVEEMNRELRQLLARGGSFELHDSGKIWLGVSAPWWLAASKLLFRGRRETS